MIFVSVTQNGYCHCGCGQLTPLAKWNDKRRGAIKGSPLKFCPCHTSIKKAERWKDKDGYILVHKPSHPNANYDGYVREHILIIENELGRLLISPECVHHNDSNPGNNKLENLTLCPSQAYHMMLHQRMRALTKCGNADYRKCKICKNYDDIKNMVFRPSNNIHLHKSCWAEYARNKRRISKERKAA